MKATPRRARPNRFTREKARYKNNHAPTFAGMLRLVRLRPSGIAARVATPLRYNSRWYSPLCHENSRPTHYYAGKEIQGAPDQSRMRHMTPLEFDLQESGDPLMPVQLIASLEGPRTTTRGVQLEVGFRPSLGGSDFERMTFVMP